MEKTKKCPTHFLSDEPAAKDEFGPHERIARAILDLVCSSSNGKGINAIALEGAWGSGKSTVIKLFEDYSRNAECDVEIATFLYDTWVHQGDSLRRSFLENLIDFLVERQWIEKEEWEKEKEILARRQEETTITTTPYLTGWGKIMAILLGMVPFGMALATMNGEVAFWRRQVGICFTALPVFLVALIVFLRWIWRGLKSLRKAKCFFTNSILKKQHKDDRAKQVGHTQNKAADSDGLLSLFLHQTKEVQKTKTVRTPEPTSVEFSQTFSNIMEEALTCEENRRLIIVVDNLDRLPSEDALGAWATMRAFFEARQGKWQQHLYLLVPYAPEALTRLWGESPDANKKEDTATAFIEKTFQVRFRVSPPVLTSWAHFMKKMLRNAFPEHREGHFDTIVRLFRLKGIPNDRPLTPRDIKLFINRLGAIHAQWGDEIPLPLQAAYVLHEKQIKNLAQDLAQSDFLDASVKNLLQEHDWQRYFAALYFNVPPEKALHVLLGQQVEKALEEGNADAVQAFKEIPGLEEVVETIMDFRQASWAEDQPEVLARIPLVLKDISGRAKAWNTLWQEVRRAVMKVSSPLGQFGQTEADGLRILLQRYPDDQNLMEHTISLLQNRLAAISEDSKGRDSAIQRWVSGACTVLSEIANLGFESVISQSFVVTCSPSTYVEIMLALTTTCSDEKVRRYFKPSMDGEDVVAHLVDAVESKDIRTRLGQAIGVMAQINPDWPWQDFVNAVKATPVLEPLQWQELLEAIWNTHHFAKGAEAEHTDDAFQEIAQGRALHYLHASHRAENWQDVAWNLLTILRWNPNEQHRGWQNSSAGLTIYRKILNDPSSHSKILEALVPLTVQFLTFRDVLDIYGESRLTEKWIEALLEEILVDKPGFISPAPVIEAYPTFQDLSPALQEKIIQKTGSALIQQLIEKGFETEYVSLYTQILSVQAQPEQAFLEFLRTGLQKVDTEQWEEALQEQDSLWDLLHALLEKKTSPALGVAFSDALLHWAENLIGEEEGLSEEEGADYSILPDALENNARKTFWRSLRYLLIRDAQSRLTQVLDVFGEGLIEAKVLHEKADEVVMILFREIAKRGIEEELRWMLKALKKSGRAILNRTKKETLPDFLERLENLQNEDIPEDIKNAVEQWAKKVEAQIEKRNA